MEVGWTVYTRLLLFCTWCCAWNNEGKLKFTRTYWENWHLWGQIGENEDKPESCSYLLLPPSLTMWVTAGLGGHLHYRTAPKPGPGFRGEGCGSSKRCMTGCHTIMVGWYLSDNLYKRPCLLPSLRAKQSLGLHFCLLNSVHIITETNSSPEIHSEGNSQNIVPINFC